jgi:hypothetical protein
MWVPQAVSIEKLDPNQGRIGDGSVTVKIFGRGFRPQAKLKLSTNDGFSLQLSELSVDSPTQISARVEIAASSKTGSYIASIQNLPADNLSDADCCAELDDAFFVVR